VTLLALVLCLAAIWLSLSIVNSAKASSEQLVIVGLLVGVLCLLIVTGMVRIQ
jgi:hypothetical protein